MDQEIQSELRSSTTKHTFILHDDIITEQINEKTNTANVHSTTETEKTKKNIIKHLEYTKKCTADKISEKAKALQEPAPQKRIKTPDRKDEHKPSEKANKNNKSQEDLNPAQSKYPVSFRGRMRPDPSIQHHPAYPLLFKYATEGCRLIVDNHGRESTWRQQCCGDHIHQRHPQRLPELFGPKH